MSSPEFPFFDTDPRLKGLGPGQRRQFARFLTCWDVPAGAPGLLNQEPWTGPVWFQGDSWEWRDKHGPGLPAGEALGWERLTEAGVWPDSLVSRRGGRLWFWQDQDAEGRQAPAALRRALGLSAVPRSAYSRYLSPGERLLDLRRRSRWIPWLQSLLPLSLLAGVLFGFTLAPGEGLVQAGTALAVGLLGLWLLGLAFHWRFNVLILTSRSLLHRRWSLKDRRAGLVKIPLAAIQNLQFERRNFWDYAGGFASLQVRTTALPAGLEFSSVPRFRQWQALYEAARSQARPPVTDWRLRAAETLGAGRAPRLLKAPESEKAKVLGSWHRQGEWIVFRKHPVTFWARTWWMLGLLLGLTGLSAWLPFVEPLPPLPLHGVLWILSLVTASRFGYLLWDWLNDLYRAGPEGVEDIDRKPFWGGESRKQAPWSAVQGFQVLRKGWAAWLWDFGDLEVLTGGAQIGLIFESVAHPEMAQVQLYELRERALKPNGSGLPEAATLELKELLTWIEASHPASPS